LVPQGSESSEHVVVVGLRYDRERFKRKNRFWADARDGRRPCVAFSRAKDALFVIMDVQGARDADSNDSTPGQKKYLTEFLRTAVVIRVRGKDGPRVAMVEMEERLNPARL
jgi:hypothetical protein